ncbi:GDSL esterase/lipase At2g30310 [Gossypium hirsutum]|uniref:GDSL esterase/lipase At2g30310 n=1 Tax=Gossypium hirsutum TaxID=3635 RepID=A0A1U8PMB0_GOSHI|nr:GDSL esterase/lipase At2g30310-like [Gossypium hirsutum]
MSSSKSNLFMVALLLVSMTIINTCGANASTNPKFPAIVIFGDLTVDPGNNNYIDTIFKGNIAPYGINFPGHVPTGRFSDGKLVTDFVASSLGINPFLDPNLSNDDLCTGVSFASADSGYDDLTTLLSMSSRFQGKLRCLKATRANNIIAKALVVVSAGTNDLIFNFFDLPTRRLEFDISGYQSFLLQRLEDFVKQIYDLGCRNIVVAGLPPVGCLPVQMTFRLENPMNRQCLENQNSDARSYNKKLVKLFPKIQVELPRSKLVYTDIYQPLMDMITHPQQYGIVETTVGCCGTGVLGLSLFCNSVI